MAYDSVSQLIKAHRGFTGKPIKMENGGSVKLTHDHVRFLESTRVKSIVAERRRHTIAGDRPERPG